MEQRQLTYGEKAVGLTFNPSNDDVVHAIKTKFAEVIDTLHALGNTSTNDAVCRLVNIAIVEAQSAQMWAVKAVTWK